MTISYEAIVIVWAVTGAAAHLFWWWKMRALSDGISWFLCLLTLPLAAGLGGIIIFPLEALLYWLIGPFDA